MQGSDSSGPPVREPVGGGDIGPVRDEGVDELQEGSIVNIAMIGEGRKGV
jgi:hypothetical protein